jgi:hypothetical protein
MVFKQSFLYNFIYWLVGILEFVIQVQLRGICIDFTPLDNGLIRWKHVVVMTTVNMFLKYYKLIIQ